MTAVRLAVPLALAAACALALRADGPQDNIPEKVRPIPPAGMKLDGRDEAALKGQLAALGKAIGDLRAKLAGRPELLALLPDVEVLHRAVALALEMNQFYAPADVDRAKKLLRLGVERARLLAEGRPTWTAETGLAVRGFRSRLDDSVQPYGLVVPASYRADGGRRHRLDVWLHGRGERTAELQFLDERLRSAGHFAPRDAFVVHPYGRYCNAFRFAGEVDVLEAVADVMRRYPIDADRVVVRGFSMGGAGCWHLAVHHPGLWCAAAPGAGFSETPKFLEDFQQETLRPTWYEKKLWRLYDCDGHAGNLFNLPTVAYSGEKDIQKQAADVMAEALRREGIDLVHVVGKGAGHGYTDRAKEEIDRRVDRVAARGRDRAPARVRFTTYTLRYNRSHWLTVDGLARHWERADVEAALVRGEAIEVKTKGVTALTLSFGPGDCPLGLAAGPAVTIDGQPVFPLPRVRSDRSWSASFHRHGKKWKVGSPAGGLRKRHGLQGPIDDAFMGRFVFVRPTGKPMHEKTGAWVKAEMARAVREWRRHFRGDPIVKDDTAITEADLAGASVVLWGDPSSNKVLARLADKLPFRWTAGDIRWGKAGAASSHHVLLMIYPNPLAPGRYVVLNSGFTFREYDYLNNARQTPKLPDWAVLDVTVSPTSQFPGRVVEAGFFGEDWGLPAAGAAARRERPAK